jgi:IS30 family transposase
MATDLRKPTSSETSLDQRQRIVRLSEQGHSAQEVATLVGVSRWTVLRWVRRYRQAGEVGLAYRPADHAAPIPRPPPRRYGHASRPCARSIRAGVPG